MNKTKTYIPQCGENIEDACKAALSMSMESGESVDFTFNDVTLIANPKGTISELLNAWEGQSEALRQKYLQSKEYRDYQIKRKKEVAQKQKKVDDIIDVLPFIIKDELRLMICIRDLADNADDVDVKLDYANLADILEKAGHIENIHVGAPKEWFHEKKIMAEYIVGQVINCLKMNMPPMPVTVRFCNEYLAMK